MKRSSAADEVRSQLLHLIESGKLPVGARLPSEHAMAHSFGVSRAVVREGLGGLRSIGVVESRAGAGSYVRSRVPLVARLRLAGRYSSDEFHEIRAALEVPGAGLAARRGTHPQVVLLRKLTAEYGRAQNSEDWISLDLDFHRIVAEATQSELQIRFVTELGELQRELNRTVASVSAEQKAPAEEHAAIVGAIARRDEDAARNAMGAHLLAVRDRSMSI